MGSSLLAMQFPYGMIFLGGLFLSGAGLSALPIRPRCAAMVLRTIRAALRGTPVLPLPGAFLLHFPGIIQQNPQSHPLNPLKIFATLGGFLQ